MELRVGSGASDAASTRRQSQFCRPRDPKKLCRLGISRTFPLAAGVSANPEWSRREGEHLTRWRSDPSLRRSLTGWGMCLLSAEGPNPVAAHPQPVLHPMMTGPPCQGFSIPLLEAEG